MNKSIGWAAGSVAAAGARRRWRRKPWSASPIPRSRSARAPPFSGPASVYGQISTAKSDYFKMINEQGGINGRKINLIALDDGYSPPKAIEVVRRLIEEEQVAILFQTIGTASERRDPQIRQPEKGPRHLAWFRRVDVRNGPEGVSLEHSVPAKLSAGGADVRAIHPGQASRMPRSASYTRTTTSAGITSTD